MASPQRENGHLDVANELAEALALASLSGAQFRLMWVVLRKTYGWNKSTDAISVSQFTEATGLHPKVIQRDLRDLAKRRYILAWGDNHHPKTFAIQKDYEQWDEGEVGTKMLPLRRESVNRDAPTPGQSGNQTVPKWEPYGSKVGTKTLPTITTSTNTTRPIPEETEPHGSGTLRDRFEKKYHDATNKTAVIGELFSLLLGHEPDFRRLGGMAKRLNSGGKLMDFIIDAAKRRITDNPHDYLDGMIASDAKRRRQAGVEEVVTIDGGKTISADAARKLTKFANVKLGGD